MPVLLSLSSGDTDEREPLPPTIVLEVVRRVPSLRDGDLVTLLDVDTAHQLQRLDRSLQHLIELHTGQGHVLFQSVTYGQGAGTAMRSAWADLLS